MAWKINLTEESLKQLKKLDQHEAKRIKTFFRERLAKLDDPRSIGKGLTGTQLGSYWRYRLGDYRIVCDIQDNELCILVVTVCHRRDVYR